MSGWQARHFSELPVHITGCQGSTTTTTTITMITAPAFDSFKGPGSEYCAEDGMISESGSLGQHDCESRCTAHPACNYISMWASGGLNWCRLNTACEIFSQQSGHTINIFEKATPPGRRLAQLQMDVSGGSVFV
mmetsp:Transcript_150155/g.273102  ORF Transcript_150155/g.273102 Transcript_150155/m.273102 type:complete len:134 (+) Transcript_150155:3-404(+)